MSVTIHVENDNDSSVRSPCGYCDERSNNHCECCQGSGIVYESKYQLNMTNDNFKLFWKGLGISVNDELCGKIYSSNLYTRLVSFTGKLDNNNPGEFFIKTEGKTVYCKLTEERLKRYISTMMDILEYAMKKEEWIVWD